MKFGVATFVTDEGIRPDLLGRALEERGFESLFVAEHSHIPLSRETPYPGGGELPRVYYRTLDPFVSLTAAAVATENLLVGTGIALVVQRDTIHTAKEVASLDLVVANPPYLPTAVLPTLPPEVSRHEPRAALDGGPDGMAVIRRIIAGAPPVLKPGGWLLMEIGDDQAGPVASLMAAEGFAGIRARRDLNGVERYIGGRWEPAVPTLCTKASTRPPVCSHSSSAIPR